MTEPNDRMRGFLERAVRENNPALNARQVEAIAAILATQANGDCDSCAIWKRALELATEATDDTAQLLDLAATLGLECEQSSEGILVAAVQRIKELEMRVSLLACKGRDRRGRRCGLRLQHSGSCFGGTGRVYACNAGAGATDDTARLDWLQGESRVSHVIEHWGWIARNSTLGRGYRLHETSDLDHPDCSPTVREAIDAAMKEGE